MKKSNIVLIGMPSSGKSSIGGPLSQKLGFDFIDTDKIIIEKEGRALGEIVNNDGLDRFLEIQESVLLNIDVKKCVISTGGSVVYNEKGMNHLKTDGFVVFLKTSLSDIQGRINSNRRFAREKEQTLEDLYNERVPLYEKFSDISVDCSGKKVGELVEEICRILVENAQI